ncbi:MAG: GGDEF-domain containing protein [Candidatus Rokuibacteriota bacterium]|nr:MAG: GGDEF-domain containing protein [Candidatus Rokubacteria bacterium]
MHRLPKLGLLGRFSLMSLIPIVLLGLILAHTLRNQVRSRSLANARQSAELVSQSAIQPRLSPSDVAHGLTPRHVRALDKEVRDSRIGTRVARIKVWNRAHTVVYSDDRKIVDKKFPPSDELQEALEGHVASEVSNVQKAENTGERKYGQLLEVYVPLQFASRATPAGAFEIYLPYRPIAAAIDRDTKKLYLILFAGLALLYLALFRIVSSASRRLRRHAAENRHQALHDALTDLPNRTLFHDRIEQALRHARRERVAGAVLLIDLDHFKEVNDTLGHQKGDLLLKDIGVRLRGALRESDTIARLGGDEFGVLLPHLDSGAGAIEVAEKIRAALERDFVIDDLPVGIDASVGIALYPEHGEDVDILLQHADVAMYEAKRTHSGIEHYSVEHDPYNPVRLAMVGELRKGLEQNEVLLHYQPKVDLETGKVAGAEALVRWQHPARGLISPVEFVPMAERTGLIRPLSRYVLNMAIGQCHEWTEAGLALKVSVNLSTRNLLDPTLPDDVARLLGKWHLPASLLELEITESTIMVDPKRAMEVLRRLNEMGITLSIDDFGTGYSSLAYLKELPVNELKIDRTFVEAMTSNRGDAFIVRSTIDLAHNLRLQVVAEGVEDAETMSELTDLGCNVAQGFHLSRPLPPHEFWEWLVERGEVAAVTRVA